MASIEIAGHVRRVDAIATDLDRTLTDAALRPVPRAMRELQALRRSGIYTILVTGRTLPELRGGRRFLAGFDAVVLEGGAVVGDASTLAPVRKQAPTHFVRWLQQRAIPHVAGACSISLPWGARAAARAYPRRDRLAWNRNRDRLDVTWRGIDKGTGVRRALRGTGISWKHVLAFGDGENDLPLFRRTAWGVAVANAAPVLKDAAAETAPGYGGRAVAAFLARRFIKAPTRN